MSNGFRGYPQGDRRSGHISVRRFYLTIHAPRVFISSLRHAIVHLEAMHLRLKVSKDHPSTTPVTHAEASVQRRALQPVPLALHTLAEIP